MRFWSRLGFSSINALVCLAWLGLAVLIVPLAWYIGYEQQATRISAVVAGRADAYVDDVRETLSRYDTLPTAIARVAEITQLLSQTSPDMRMVRAAGVQLVQYAVSFRTNRIMVVNRDGTVVATDDWLINSQKLLGQHVGHYSMVRNALRGESKALFTLGLADSGVTYLAASPVIVGGQPIGAIIVEARPFEAREHWFTGEDTVLVLDDQGYTVLASQGDWRFRQMLAARDAAPNQAAHTTVALPDTLIVDQAPSPTESADRRLHVLEPLDRAGEYASSIRGFQDIWTIAVLRPLAEAQTAGLWAAVFVGALCLTGMLASITVLLAMRLRWLVHDRLPIDPLTGLFTKRAVLERFAFLQAIKNRGLAPDVALVVFDVKDLRRINLRYGRAVGDKVLRELGTLMRRQVRTTDLAFRLGKDDLAALLPVRDMGGAIVFAQRVQKALAHSKNFAGLPDDTVKMNFGIALCMPGDNLDDAAARAEQHLRRQLQDQHENLRSAA